MNEFYKSFRGPKTDFSLLEKHREVWMPKLKRFEENENGCWEWTGAINNNGYGVVYVYREGEKRKLEYVHRVSMFLKEGDYGNDVVVDHMCKNSKCFNPDHLRILSHEENAKSAVEKTHCGVCGELKIRGRDGRLYCASCQRKYTRKHRDKKRNACKSV